MLCRDDVQVAYAVAMAVEQRSTIRIGELSRRTGVSPELLRAWEQRYGLLEPERTDGGFRLYGALDEARIRTMQSLLRQGISTAEAAALAKAGQATGTAPRPPGQAVGDLRAALDRFDGAAAQAQLDGLLAQFSHIAVIRDVVIPYLHELGERWTDETASIAQEHFASSLLRGRLLGLSRTWDMGGGPRAVVACPPGEQHDLGLIAFGIALREEGWRVTYLGQDTPIATLASVVADVLPDLVVLSAATPERFAGVRDQIAELAAATTIALAGPGATADGARAVGASHLAGGILESAQAAAQLIASTTAR